jgi:hypothetical protein
VVDCHQPPTCCNSATGLGQSVDQQLAQGRRPWVHRAPHPPTPVPVLPSSRAQRRSPTARRPPAESSTSPPLHVAITNPQHTRRIRYAYAIDPAVNVAIPARQAAGGTIVNIIPILYSARRTARAAAIIIINAAAGHAPLRPPPTSSYAAVPPRAAAAAVAAPPPPWLPPRHHRRRASASALRK